MPPPKKGKKKRQYNTPVYNDICYVCNPKSTPMRCSNDRLHFYIESAYLEYNNHGQEYYQFAYKKSKKEIISLGSAKSFEDILRQLNTALSQDSNKDKKIGDLVILTHATWYYYETEANKIETETVKIQLPLFSLRNPDNTQRSLPIFWHDVSEEIGTAEISKLRDPNSDYYKFVDGKDSKEGLLSLVVSNINNYLDESSHIWLVGCNLGLAPDFLKAIRKLFSDKPTIYAFNKYHYILYLGNISDPISWWEEVREDEQKAGTRLWTEEGMKAIVHEP